MPLCETEAIVLRTHRVGEADKIVSLFSRQFGRIRAAASGAQRSKSRYGGLLEPLTYIRLWLFERENRDLFRVNSAELLETFFGMQSEYRVHLAAQYLAEAAERFLPEREVNERTFRLYLAVLRGLKTSGEVDRPLVYFDYWLLRLGGFLPPLGACSSCGTRWAGDAIFRLADSVGLVCNRCRRPGKSLQISPDILPLLETASQLPLDRWMISENRDIVTAEARRTLEVWVELAAERKLVTLSLLGEGGPDWKV